MLSNKPSTMIKQALKDLDRAKKAGAIVNMGDWYYKSHEGVCTVCLAGAVLFHEFELNHEEEAGPYDLMYYGLIKTSEMLKLLALNEFRSGAVMTALETMGVRDQALKRGYLPIFFTSDGSQDTSEWRRDMQRLVESLEEVGL